ncbi:unnamed protein product [Clonostachys chloroleuca]|uniref:Uncharacterized protein n=1 Tax=Clonostachys chloroleuca TaxID=1926264 RepID=A0AA35Q4W9_9HYPO|nr:unnamed protein product [Clonostachys chloroleuca]
MDDPEKEAEGVDDEQVLVVRDSSYPLSRFSAKYLSQIIRKDVSDKRVYLRSLPIPRIEILYHELGFGKESALDGTLPDHVRRNAFRSALKMFRKNIFTGGTQLPTQIADWHSSTCLLKFEGFASEFLDRHGAQFWGDEDSNEDRNGITIAKHQDLIHFLVTQILFQSALNKKTFGKSSVKTCSPTPNPGLPESNLGKSQEMVLSPSKSAQRPGGDGLGASKVQETSQPPFYDTALAISPRKPSTVGASANLSPLARKRPRPSSTEDRSDAPRPRAAFWYRIVYSRIPYSVEIWKPRKNLHFMSLTELKADLPSEVGRSTRKLVLHLTGPDLCLKSRLDLTDEEAFAYVKGQMRMLVEPIVAQYQQKGKNAVFDVEIEVMSDE